MVVPQPMELTQRWYEGEFEWDDDPDDIEELTSGRAARAAMLNQVSLERDARSQAIQATSAYPNQYAVVQGDGSTRNAFAQAEGPQDDMADDELDIGRVNFDGYTYLAEAELAPESEVFAPFMLLKKYLYLYSGKANQKKVAEGYFDKGQIYNYSWDFFYIHRLQSQDLSAIILVPTSQFEEFLETINKALRTHLTIPSGNPGEAFRVSFDRNGTPCPRYLGRAANSSEFEVLRTTGVWPRHHKLDKEPAAMKPTDSSIEAFISKIDLMTAAQKAKNKANKEEAKQNRNKSKKEWGQSIKRVQRYVGFRAVREKEERDEPKTDAAPWDKCVPAPKIKSPLFKANELVPSDRDKDVVFVCIDIEAMELNSQNITEIGIASIDTRDLATVAPGENGENLNWFKHIHARHFRIEEYKHHVNNVHCKGCPDDFDFGESEFVRKADRIPYLESCLKDPFSKRERGTVRTPESDMNDLPKRNIVLVGHDLQQDINYLEKMCYSICHLSNIIDHVDTKLMYQYLMRASQPTSLSNILYNLGIPGWNPHNAGNDAAHTLMAMLGIAIRHLTDKERPEEKKVEFEMAEGKRIEEARADAEAAVKDQFDGWSSAGEGSDGGDPIRPSPSPDKVKKGRSSRPLQETPNTPTKPQRAMKDTNGSWRAPQAGSQVNKAFSGAGIGTDKTTTNGEPYVFPPLRYLKKKTTAWEDETPSPAPSGQYSGVSLDTDGQNAGGEQYFLPHLRYLKKETTAQEHETPLSAPSGKDEDLITFHDDGANNSGAGSSSANTNTETKTRRTTAWEDEEKPPQALKQNANHFAAGLQEKTSRTTTRFTVPKPSTQGQDEFHTKIRLLHRRLEATNPRSTAWEDETEEQAAINNALAEASPEEMKIRHQGHNPTPRSTTTAGPQAARQSTNALAGLNLGEKKERPRRTTAWDDEPKVAEQTTNALAGLSLEQKKERTSEWVSGSGSASTSMSGWGEEFLKVEGKGVDGGGKEALIRLGSGIGNLKPTLPNEDGGN